MLNLILFGVPLVIIVIAALLMPWHAKRGEKRRPTRKTESNGDNEF